MLFRFLFSALLLTRITTAFVCPPSSSASSKQSSHLHADLFTGGAFDKQESEAAQLASRIKSVKDLGWTSPSKRRGNTRPRHRAFGGESEKPVQEKPNYDETNPLCVEKWLTQEEFYNKVGDSGPAADTVFVALAGGGAFAERDVAAAKIAQWRSSANNFDEQAFLKSVQEGGAELALGWGLFSGVVGFAVAGIILPTNPTVKAFEGLLAQIVGEPVAP